MDSPGRTGERAVVLFLVALLAFNPPLLSVFASDALVFGVPLLYLYLFCTWGLVILLIGLNVFVAEKQVSQRRLEARASSDILLSEDRKGP